MTRRRAAGLAAAAGIGALGYPAAQAQQGDREPQVDEQDLRGLTEEESPPLENEEGKELGAQEAQALRAAFIGPEATFLLASGRAIVLIEFRSALAANRASLKEDANFYYVTISPRFPRFAIAKRAGLLGKHQVWIKFGARRWQPYEKAVQKRLEGNLL